MIRAQVRDEYGSGKMSRVQVRDKYGSGQMSRVQVRYEQGSGWKDFQVNLSPELTHAPHLRIKAGLLYLLPESSGKPQMPYFTLFYLNQIKSIFIPTSSHFKALWKTFNKSRLHNLCKETLHIYLHRRLQREFAHIQFFLYIYIYV